MVKVKLNLDDVFLLDLNVMVEEDEDIWLVNRKVFWFWLVVRMFWGVILFFLFFEFDKLEKGFLNDRCYFLYFK